MKNEEPNTGTETPCNPLQHRGGDYLTVLSLHREKKEELTLIINLVADHDCHSLVTRLMLRRCADVEAQVLSDIHDSDIYIQDEFQ